MQEVYNLEDNVGFDGVDIDTGLCHDEESSKEKLNRPIRNKRISFTVDDHMLYK